MDIKTISDLLNAFVSAEAEILNKHQIKDATTIGTMFEGLTESILNKSIFEGLNLRVVKNSFIVGCDTELDVLLVEGEGVLIPYTDRYIYKTEQVIVVIQVKKNLFSKDLEHGFNNLRSLIDYFHPRQPDPYVVRLFRNAFKAICRKDITAKEAGELTQSEEFIFPTLRLEAFLPLRIIWGYNGFASEYNFRKSFYEYLNKNLTTDLSHRKLGFGPINFPSLIICGKYSMMKQNGMPFGVPFIKDWWPFYTSSSFNPTYFFLEAIWTRLSFKFEQIPTSIFGDDLTMEPVNRYLDCRIKELNGNFGWEYNYFVIKNESLLEHIEPEEWKPVELDLTQHVIINELCQDGEIDIVNDLELEKYVVSGNYSSLTDFINKLKDTGLVYVEKGKLRLLTDQCQSAITPNGKYVAGENKSGRFSNWLIKEIAKQKQKE